jgi:hypothetical protein
LRIEKLHRVVPLSSAPCRVLPAPLPHAIHPPFPDFAHAASTPVARLFAGLRRYLRQERAFWTANDDVELWQLLDRLRAVVDNDRGLRKAASPLIFLIGSDLLKSQRDDQSGLSAISARPMRAWRQRYNGLEEYLGA